MKTSSTFFKKIGRTGYFSLAIAVTLALLFAWGKVGFPRSLAEARFLWSLKSATSDNEQQINLAELMPGNWELVCESHGYDEPLHLKKYNKTFPTAGAMQDGAWGLIFIEANGAYELVSSSFGLRIGINFWDKRCLSREEALLTRVTNGKYISFETTRQFKPATETN